MMPNRIIAALFAAFLVVVDSSASSAVLALKECKVGWGGYPVPIKTNCLCKRYRTRTCNQGNECWPADKSAIILVNPQDKWATDPPKGLHIQPDDACPPIPMPKPTRPPH
jgi:hypothetical protein